MNSSFKVGLYIRLSRDDGNIESDNTDTNCCIVGSVAESLYGMNEKEKKDAVNGLPNEYVKVLKIVYK